jgi:predicted kinase
MDVPPAASAAVVTVRSAFCRPAREIRPLVCLLTIHFPAAMVALLLMRRTASTDVIGLAAVPMSNSPVDEITMPPRSVRSDATDRLKASVAEGMPVIVDATHAKRPWRLAMIQALELPQPVEWIGWWLTTPIETCLAWNRSRQRMVPEPVIHQFTAALADPVFAPDRSEGFSALVDFDPSLQSDLTAGLRDCLKGLEKRIAAARNREKSKELHGYSRLLDLERLLYLIQLLSRYPGLSAHDSATREELERGGYGNFGTVLAGGSRSITVSKTSDAGDCDAIPNTVTVAATNEPAGATGNDTSRATIVVNCPDQPSNGVYFFENVTGPTERNPFPHLEYWY